MRPLAVSSGFATSATESVMSPGAANTIVKVCEPASSAVKV